MEALKDWESEIEQTKEKNHGNHTRITYKSSLNLSYEEAIEKVTAALKEEGIGVLTEVDVKVTVKKKLDADFKA